MKWNMKIIVSKFWPLILFHHKEAVGFDMLEVKCVIELFSHFNQVDFIIYLKFYYKLFIHGIQFEKLIMWNQ
jgi:hypothetical protein